MVCLLKMSLISSVLMLFAINMASSVDSKAFTTILSTCKDEVQPREIFFTGECSLKKNQIQSNVLKVRDFVVSKDDNLNVHQLLYESFANSSDFFLSTQPQFTSQYRGKL